ncbi:M14 family zinc carboxypeptidase [Pseudoalteromonas luteoviolacea]|uniref:M14 family zinc carboxypeptidase n=1 Tax=Pseudoalteromonas luteoviolacea TaxID=43657 RepID=UPI00115381B3|nr:M14 family zinc carboxypeptidase [Pseudoalteromonas luteoviolacea]TQF72972.1 peptidase M14 [Pseudoalteromonas luteoviolacea]
MRIMFFLLGLLVFHSQAKPLSYYFPSGIEFDQSITKPSEVLGYEVGQWHVRHDQLVNYLTVLAQQSPRMSISTIGYSHERRPLILLSVTSKSNQNNLEQLRQTHLESLNTDKDRSESPNVIWMGYSVHGNEPSGSNAALLLAYYLAAAQGEEINALLENNIILIDPALNPDGLARFAHWANSNRGLNLSADPSHREHVEAWPSSRTNHYWFDLNRDWLLLQHPESQARVEQFHRWKPSVLTDFHEMGTNSSYFFQPGIPSRTHPITPIQNQTLTHKLAEYHAETLDAEQQLYFTQESFDDFYVGKGSTYPDINGAVGILFEQASSRGHVQESINGDLYFHRTIKNQLLTSLSTFKGAMANKAALMAYQQSFYLDAQELASKEDVKGYVVSKGADKARFEAFIELLSRHQITVYEITKSIKVAGKTYQPKDIFVPLSQAQYRLVKAVFSTQKNFADNTFYDVSGWTLPHAFDLNFAPIKSRWGLKTAAEPRKVIPLRSQNEFVPDAYAYAFSWDEYTAPKLLNELLKEGVDARVALQSFSARTSQGEQTFSQGTIVIPAGVQTNSDWQTRFAEMHQRYAIEVFAIRSGLTAQGIDLGSRLMMPLIQPKVLLVGGKGTSQYEVGEMWYHLDRHVGIAPTLIEQHRLARADLSRYTHIIMVDGNYRGLSKQVKTAIMSWVKKGGIIWGHKRGAQWLIEQQLLNVETISRKEMRAQFESKNMPFSERESLAAKQRIAGAIFNARADLSHPLAFGLEDEILPVFKNSTWVMKPNAQPFTSVLKYTDSPLLSGYADQRNVTQIAASSVLIADEYGKGVAIAMTDNPVFRGYWYGTSKLVNNALFFANALK